MAVKVFVGVSRNLSLQNNKPGDKGYWCVFKSTQRAEPGDFLLLYFPVGVSATRSGINQIYRITSNPQNGVNFDCDGRGMAHVSTELIVNLKNRITMKDLKGNSVIRNWGAIGRNMQSATFNVPEGIWIALKDLIISKNPEIQFALELAANKVEERHHE